MENTLITNWTRKTRTEYDGDQLILRLEERVTWFEEEEKRERGGN